MMFLKTARINFGCLVVYFMCVHRVFSLLEPFAERFPFALALHENPLVFGDTPQFLSGQFLY